MSNIICKKEIVLLTIKGKEYYLILVEKNVCTCDKCLCKFQYSCDKCKCCLRKHVSHALGLTKQLEEIQTEILLDSESIFEIHN